MFGSRLLNGCSVASLFVIIPAYALQFGEPIIEPVMVTNPAAKGQVKYVTLMNWQLSPKDRQVILQRPYHAGIKADQSLPLRVDLGMNHVPVLDQGQHGTCVTFANTAAIDAALYARDYVSQLCGLELGSYLESNSFTYNGWRGSWGPIVLNQMMRFGIVNKAHQQAGLCSGIKEYPKQKTDEGMEVAPTEYKKISENLNDLVNWQHILSDDSLSDEKPSPIIAEEMDAVLAKTKQALAKGHRLTFGTALVIANGCTAGACAKYNANNDTWALTAELNFPTRIGGHEMVIFGYDDTAIAYDKEGNAHQGLLKLRNSWNTDVGDNGNFYMSYDYFKKYVHEVQEIIPLAEKA